MSHDDLRAFTESLSRADTPTGLFHSALLLSAIHHDQLPAGWWRRSHDILDQLVEDARFAIGFASPGDDHRLLQELVHYFCTTLGFRGDTEHYHHPDNSCLDRVLTRRRGLPITLSILLCTLGARFGLQMHGIGARGHFLAAARIRGSLVYIDPFNGPDLYDEAEIIDHLSEQTGLPGPAIAPTLQPSPPLHIVQRMLNNLKVTYSRSSDVSRLVRTLDWLLALEPDNPDEMLTRGLLLLRLGETHRGAQDLLHYVALGSRDPRQIERIRQELLHAHLLRARLN